MYLERVQHPTTLEIRYSLYISDIDICSAKLTPIDHECLHYFGRHDATVEERLMGLQILARAIEETEIII